MVRDPGHHNIVLIDRNNTVDHPEGDLLALQGSALLDVQFDVSVVRALANERGLESLGISANSTNRFRLREPARNHAQVLGVALACRDPATIQAPARKRGFLASPYHRGQRPSRLYPAILKNTQEVHGGQRPQIAIEVAAARNRVDM